MYAKRRGFSLVELMIGIAILGILLGLAGPGFAQWLRDAKIRNQAESVMNGLQQARGEAIKRNTVVRFQLVTASASESTIDATCALTFRSNFWVISHGDPTGQCNLPESLTSPPPATAEDPYAAPPAVLLVTGFRTAANYATQTDLVIGAVPAGPDPVVCFDGNGRVQRRRTDTGQCTGSSNPGTTVVPAVRITVSNPGTGTCLDAGGTQRCLWVQLSPSGEARMCDPAIAATAITDPRRCS